MTALLLSTSHPVEAVTPLSATPKPSSATKSQPVTARPDRVSAALSAQLQGSRVLVTDELTESTATYVNPDGTITLEASSGPSRIKQGDTWTDIDTTLVASDGVLKPRAAFGGLEVSAGGDQKPLVKLVPGEGKEYALAAPAKLPAPVVQGNKAVYPDAAGHGADIVVTALPTGVRHDVVLRQRPAGPVEFRFPVKTKGLSLSETKEGMLQLTAGKGKVLAAAPRPFMFDARAAQAKPQDAVPTPSGSAKVGEIDVRITGSEGTQEMVIRPDPEFLQDPSTTYPVTVDPAVVLPMREGRTIMSPCPDGDEFTGFRVEVGLTDFACPSNWSAKVFSRALLDFDTSSLAGQQVANARLDLVGDLWSCPTGQQLKVQRTTGAWDPDDVFWDNQPTVTDTGAVTSAPPAICNPASSPAADVPWSIAITDIAKSWAAGAQGRGLMLRATVEDKTRPTFAFDFHDSGADLPKLVVTYGATPWVEHLRTVPVASPTRELQYQAGEEPQITGRLFTTTTRPTLQSGVRGTGATLRADFEIEHDPATTGQGNGLIWSGSANVPSGEVARATVPEGVLQDGWRIRWRSKGVDGDLESAWSQWQRVSIDASRPQEPTVYCAGTAPEGAWRPRGEVNCSLESASKDVTEYIWEFDNPNPSNIQEAGFWEDSLGETREIKQTLSDGWHTLYVRTRDKAHNTSDVVAYRLGIGPGGLVTAQKQTSTHRMATLDAAAPPARDKVTYEYTTSTMPWAEWSPVPPQHVFPPGSATPITSWPQVRTDTSQNFAALSWDLAKTLEDSQEQEGLVELRACFEGGGADIACSDPVRISLSKSATGDAHAASEIGSGSVALVNGDFSLQSKDAEVFGVAVTRVHRTLNTEFDSTVPDEYKVFGPGWQVAFPAAPSWVSAYVPVDGSNKGWMQLMGPDGSTFTYTKNGTLYTGIGDAADGTSISVTNEELTVADRAGAKTTYVKVNEKWVVARTEGPEAESAVTYFRDSQARITRVLAPASEGVQCGATLVPGCRALELEYAATTTATGVASGWGDYKGNVKSLSLTAFDPETNAMKTVVLAAYAYDSTGRLRQVRDPRSNLATVYYYTGEGRISQMTPPGLAPWRMEYDSRGRLAHVTLEGGDIDPTWAVAYDVPIGGQGAPLDMTVGQTGRWGQSTGLPVNAAAVFPPSRVPPRGENGAYEPGAEDWEYAALTYMDTIGRSVNTVGFGAGAWQISTTRYDDKNNPVWHLTPGGRAQALTPVPDTDPYVAARTDSAERAHLLATVSTYDENGNLLVDLGPVRTVVLTDGEVVSARPRTNRTYDEDRPQSDTNYHLVTTTTIEPVVVDGTATPSATDARITKTGYDPVQSGDVSGWTIRKPTSTTIAMPGGTDIVHRLRYDAAGREIERRMPRSNGTDAGTDRSYYYTAGAHAGSAECGNKPEWSGWPCRLARAAQTAGKPLLERAITYTFYGDQATRTETSGTVTRTATFTYDEAGRATTSKIEANPSEAAGAPVSMMSHTFDPATGLVTATTRANGDSVTVDYDSFGRPISTTDSTGNTATVTYNLDGQIATTHDGKGLITYTYNGVDAEGKVERRGLATKVDTGAGIFTAAYNSAGSLSKQIYPAGIVATWRYDNNEKQTALSYAKGGTAWLAFSALPDIFGRTVISTGPGGSKQLHTYDAADRLSKAEDTFEGECRTRVYAFSANTNRTSLTDYASDTGGVCSTSTAANVQNYEYDPADRITNAGYSYDNFGRVTKVPAGHVAGEGDVNIGYDATDFVASLQQGDVTKTFTVDPKGRVKSVSTSGGSRPGTTTNHYAGLEDSPAWVSEPDGTWTRNIIGFTGLSAIQRSDGTVTLQLDNLHGDTVATVDAADPSGLSSYSEYTEYGLPRDPDQAAERYGWLGSHQRSSDAVGGLILMGVRLYNPATGLFLQADPIEGGSANDYVYASADPINKSDLRGTADKFLGRGVSDWSETSRRDTFTEDVATSGFGLGCGWHVCVLADFTIEVHEYRKTHTQVFRWMESRKVIIQVCPTVCRGAIVTETRYYSITVVTEYLRRVTIERWRVKIVDWKFYSKTHDTGWKRVKQTRTRKNDPWVRPRGPY